MKLWRLTDAVAIEAFAMLYRDVHVDERNRSGELYDRYAGFVHAIKSYELYTRFLSPVIR